MPRQNKGEGKKYKKLEDKEHALTRPGMYVGSITPSEEERWIYSKGKIVQKKITTCSGFEKIFDELIVNVIDHYIKTRLQHKKNLVTNIDITIDREEGLITVMNNGEGIPIVESGFEEKNHTYKDCKPTKVKLLVPELIFGSFKTSDSYDDKVKRITGGMNGYGAKLTNVYSKFFSVETVDSECREKFYQEYYDNMDSRTKPEIKKSAIKPYTKISFKADFERFNLKGISKNLEKLLVRRVYDMAACTEKNVKISLNGEQIQVRTFSDYVDLYTNKKEKVNALLENKVKAADNVRLIPKWEMCVVISDEKRNTSFVNGIYTREGSHIDYITNKLCNALSKELNIKNKGNNITPSIVEKHLWIFLNTIIINPEFDSQTKDRLKTPSKDFGFKCEIDDKIIKKILKLKDENNKTLSDVIMTMYNMKEFSNLSKQGAKKRLNIPKLEDAMDAGTKRNDGTVLIVTEGDSAKTLAVAGVSTIDPERKKYGIFPLKGKMLNVRDASPHQLANNKEIVNIMNILGLDVGKEYDFEKKKPRYMHIAAMTDQDLDGFHIKALIVNFIHYFWPSILKMDIGFYKCIVTPIVKVSKGKKSYNFYNLNDFREWLDHNDKKGWNIQYYKGLGTSTRDEAKEYFKNLKSNLMTYKWSNNEKCNDALSLAFDKKRAHDRKEWLGDYDQTDVLNFGRKTVKFSDLIHKELKHFSNSDNIRSIPSVVDGFKPAHRKIMFGCFKRNLVKNIKVSQLGGYIGEHSDYHHGEQSLYESIIKMAQTFVGSNNINLLVPQGQFGTRIAGGKDHSSPRYIYTRLNEPTKKLFHEHDMNVLDYKEDDGIKIEPKWYVPALPTILINGTDGIGTGWSTSIPCYNPSDIIKNLRRMIKGKEPNEMVPWYKDFKGTIEPDGEKSYICRGSYKKIESNVLEITELPIGVWNNKFKVHLLQFVEGGTPDKKRKSPKAKSSKAKNSKKVKTEYFIEDVKYLGSDEFVKFHVYFKPGELKDRMNNQIEFEKKMQLRNTINTSNMVLFNPEGKLVKYESTSEILKDYFRIRTQYYDKRKVYLTKKYEKEVKYLGSKVKFIDLYIKGEIKLQKVKISKVYERLEELEFPKIKARGEVEEETDEDGNYDYLVKMPLLNLTKEKMKELEKELNRNKELLDEVNNKSNYDLWQDDLDSIESSIN